MFSRFTLQPYALKDESDLKHFETLLEKRPQYELTESEMKFSYIACRILGVPNDVDEYFNELFDYSEAKGIEVLHEQNLNKVIDSEKLRHIQEVFGLHQEAPNGLTVNRLVAHLSGKQL
ncbi:YceG family protein, partial [Bacillus sp. SW7]|uniref:YceG family protein n=1 Tax=Bacillus sp. SW7 TaxID=3117397 RepID=UPI0032205D81